MFSRAAQRRDAWEKAVPARHLTSHWTRATRGATIPAHTVTGNIACFYRRAGRHR